MRQKLAVAAPGTVVSAPGPGVSQHGFGDALCRRPLTGAWQIKTQPGGFLLIKACVLLADAVLLSRADGRHFHPPVVTIPAT